MRWVEFIGTSGFGKTFLFNKLLETRGINRSWVTPEEGTKYIYHNLLANKISKKRKILNLAKSCYYFNLNP